MPSPRISLVIPAWNEEGYLPRLLDSVAAARAAFPGGGEAIEVIVADNASTDATPAIALERGCRVAPVEKRVIGAARNGGARAALGEIVAFIDADSVIHPQTFNAIDRALASRDVVAGSTGVRFDRWSAGIATTYALAVPVAWITGMDAGVVFCRREDFLAVGGYSEERLFAEDVEFLVALRRLGRTRRQRLVRLTEIKATTSARKFDRHGDWHAFTMMARAAAQRFRSDRVREIAWRYWYEGRQGGSEISEGLTRQASAAAGLLRDADAALYQAKRDGRNCVRG